MSQPTQCPVAIAGEMNLTTTAPDQDTKATKRQTTGRTDRVPLRDCTNVGSTDLRDVPLSKRRRSDDYELYNTATDGDSSATLGILPQALTNDSTLSTSKPAAAAPPSQAWLEFQALMSRSYDAVVRSCLEAMQPADAALPVFPTPNPLVGISPPVETFSHLNAHMASALHSSVISSLQSALNSLSALQALAASEFAAIVNRQQDNVLSSTMRIPEDDVSRVQRLATYQAALSFTQTYVHKLCGGHHHSTFLSEMNVPDLQRFLALAQTRRADVPQQAPIQVPVVPRRQSAPTASFENVPIGVIGAPGEAVPFPALPISGQATTEVVSSAPLDGVFKLTDPLSASVDRAAQIEEDPQPTLVLFTRDKRSIVRDFMTGQPQVTSHMRAVLLDWLRDISQENRLHEETYFLAVRLLDRVLDQVHVPRKELQLLGASALLVAAKVEEHHAPPIKHFETVCDKLYSRQQFITMQNVLTKKLEYTIHCPTAFTFLHLLFEIFPQVFDADLRNHCVFVLYLSILDFRLSTLLQSFYAHAIAVSTLIAHKRYDDAVAITDFLPLEFFREWFADPASHQREINAITVRMATADPVMYFGEAGFQYPDGGSLPSNKWVVTNPREVTRGAMLCDNSVCVDSGNEMADRVTWLLHDVCTVIRDVFHYHHSRWSKKSEANPLGYKSSHDYFGGRNFNNGTSEANLLGRTAEERFFAQEPAVPRGSCAIGKFATYSFANKFIDGDCELVRGLPLAMATRIGKEISAFYATHDE